MSSSKESGDREQPEWARSLKAAVGRRYSQSGAPPKKTVTVRTAAVLVLLTEGPSGVQVLLIVRGSGLRDYPNELSFPGGAWEEGDTDPVATALREASEEIGLNRASVEIKGLLPTVIDPQAKFMVTPVLAWSASPDLTVPVDSGEVAALHRIAIRDLAPTYGTGGHSDQAPSSDKSAAPESQLGQMTAAIIDIVSALLAPKPPRE
jgi:8-oxo-dGTP pyrophosphatase MutT (NUDIX family)